MAVIGAEKILARFRAIPAAARAEMTKHINRSANEHAALARQFAPDDPATSGNDLRSSIHTEQQSELAVAVIADAPHALHVEFGTVNMAAQPYFYPAKRLTRKRGQARIKRALRKAVKATRA